MKRAIATVAGLVAVMVAAVAALALASAAWTWAKGRFSDAWGWLNTHPVVTAIVVLVGIGVAVIAKRVVTDSDRGRRDG